MIKSENVFWGIAVVPNLPRQYLQEYMFLLGEYADCRVCSTRPQKHDDPKESPWCFPFMDIDESFDHGEFEDWTEMVERDMMERYQLTEEHFCT